LDRRLNLCHLKGGKDQSLALSIHSTGVHEVVFAAVGCEADFDGGHAAFDDPLGLIEAGFGRLRDFAFIAFTPRMCQESVRGCLEYGNTP